MRRSTGAGRKLDLRVTAEAMPRQMVETNKRTGR
jgi:hypothetical protein